MHMLFLVCTIGKHPNLNFCQGCTIHYKLETTKRGRNQNVKLNSFFSRKVKRIQQCIIVGNFFVPQQWNVYCILIINLRLFSLRKCSTLLVKLTKKIQDTLDGNHDRKHMACTETYQIIKHIYIYIGRRLYAN